MLPTREMKIRMVLAKKGFNLQRMKSQFVVVVASVGVRDTLKFSVVRFGTKNALLLCYSVGNTVSFEIHVAKFSETVLDHTARVVAFQLFHLVASVDTSYAFTKGKSQSKKK